MMQNFLPLCHPTEGVNGCIRGVTLKGFVFLKHPGQYLTDNDLDAVALQALTSKSAQCKPKRLHHFVFLLFPLKRTKSKNFS